MAKWKLKQEADRLYKVKVCSLKRWGYFKAGQERYGVISWTNDVWPDKKSTVGITVSVNATGDDGYVEFDYIQTGLNGGKRSFKCRIQLAITPCRLGGKRFWFICPLILKGRCCSRRVGVLYKGGDYFGCRHCYNLSYRSQNEGGSMRYHPIARIFKLETKIEELERGIKRRAYGGLPTKKQQRLDRIYELHDHLLRREIRP